MNPILLVEINDLNELTKLYLILEFLEIKPRFELHIEHQYYLLDTNFYKTVVIFIQDKSFNLIPLDHTLNKSYTLIPTSFEVISQFSSFDELKKSLVN